MTETMDASATSPSDGSTATAQQNDSKGIKILRRLHKLILLPYVVGILWTCLHPLVSVVTGQLKCRGWFIDENSLDATQFSYIQYAELDYLLPSNQRRNNVVNNLCDLEWIGSLPNLSCHRQADCFELLTMVPVNGAVRPVEESIVLVVPRPNEAQGWEQSKFHYALTRSIQKLSDPNKSPWLAKTIHLVSPADTNHTLEMVVSNFLLAYEGEASPALPIHFSGSMIRNMLVLDVVHDENPRLSRNNANPNEKPRSRIQVLPQGRRGNLPNMDLVFLITKIQYRLQSFNTVHYPGSSLLVHDFPQVSDRVARWVGKGPGQTQTIWTGDATRDILINRWIESMSNLLLFCRTMAFGPFPAHAPALERGIDAVSLRVHFEGSFRGRDPVVEWVQYLEIIVRALSNLHERLHHSMTLYMMPSYDTFVSHTEYLIPAILVLIPLVIRSIWILSQEGLDFLTLTLSTGVYCFAMLSMAVTDDNPGGGVLAVSYIAAVCCAFFIGQQANKNSFSPARRHFFSSSLQLTLCLAVIYSHVPLVFAHVSLGYPSALFWVPLVATPTMSSNSNFVSWLWLVISVLTVPWLLLVPRVFETFTPFVLYAYTPLHVLLVQWSLVRILTRKR